MEQAIIQATMIGSVIGWFIGVLVGWATYPAVMGLTTQSDTDANKIDDIHHMEAQSMMDLRRDKDYECN